SQEACAIPYDQTPPCPPTLSVESDCPTAELQLSWHFEDSTCARDVAQYQVYRALTDSAAFELVEVIQVLSDTSYNFVFNEPPISIAGCYAVTASDSLSLWPDGELHQNESGFSNVICLDNCPLYFLPNLFTPNGDDRNDLFRPIDWRYVESVDMKIYNRWGNVVFETTDPEILWDGREMDHGVMCGDGAYYYVIRVNTIRLSGIVPERFSGSIQLLDGSGANQQGQ
ncbi:MAG: gliding motility-associated C-terminal domain-containing protein, partial [Flavobacteriales bacterium]